MKNINILFNLKHVALILLTAGCVLLAACSSGSDDDSTTVSLTTDQRPTNWVAVNTDVDLRTTMTIDASVDLSNMYLKYEAKPNDIMAAFVEGTCRAVATPQTDDSGNTIYFLTVKRLTTDPSDAKVTLKFYSAQHSHIFTASPITYQPDGILGTYDEPYKPTWNK